MYGIIWQYPTKYLDLVKHLCPVPPFSQGAVLAQWQYRSQYGLLEARYC